MRIFAKRRVAIGGMAAALVVVGAGLASADGPRPYVVGATDLQGQTDWTGFYIGGKLGGAWSDIGWNQDANVFTTGGAVGSGTEVSFGPSGFGGGIIGGGNAQVGHWVFGVELSYSGVDLSESMTSPFFPATDTFTTKIDWLGTVEGRVGYSWSHYLLFGKVGWVGSNASLTLVNNATGVTASFGRVRRRLHAGRWPGVPHPREHRARCRVRLHEPQPEHRAVVPAVPDRHPQWERAAVDLRQRQINAVMARASYLFMPED